MAGLGGRYILRFDNGMKNQIEDLGIVGAGGAGFPLAVKLRARAHTVIVNAAECEPLLQKDKEVLLHYHEQVWKGLRTAMEHVGAKRGVVGIKEKYADLIETLRPTLPKATEIAPLSDSYPSGDEFVLVYDVTGQVIPPGGLPVQLGVVVSNVETLYNLGCQGPVTEKFLTVAGAVAHPVTLKVPVGTAFRDVIAAAGGPTDPEISLLVGGAMMAKLSENLDEPVTKTTAGIIVLPREHSLVQHYKLDWRAVQRRARSTCDQCTFCTELCPRYLLGHPIKPHEAMRWIGMGLDQGPVSTDVAFCCECNLCTLFSCPDILDPKRVCVHYKTVLKEQKTALPKDLPATRHPLADARRIPTSRLMHRLGLMRYKKSAPLESTGIRPRRVELPLRQHVGDPCTPLVKPGERVQPGDLIARPADGKLGAPIHASIRGIVRAVEESIVIETD